MRNQPKVSDRMSEDLAGRETGTNGSYPTQKIGVHPSPHGGLDITLVAPNATAVEFCALTGAKENLTEQRWPLSGPEDGLWQSYVPDLTEGTLYGFRVHGPWDPDGGLTYDANALLIDPYGRAVTEVSLAGKPQHVSVVIGEGFQQASRPLVPWNQTVLYETHVKSFTQNLPGIPEELRGTYAGLAHPAAIKHLQNLGVTSLELLPVHAKRSEPFLKERGLENYWGYSTLSFFSPEPSYATEAAQKAGPQAVVDEFRGMVSLLHEAGLELILDVVYNHTCEGGDDGPTLSWRGIDSLLYYRHLPERPRRMIDDTGTGNTVNFSHMRVVQMALDSMRYWVEEMGVDGFRFDLASTMGRLDDGFTPYHPFFVAAATDPTLRETKLIAEPWDIGPGGWQTGNYPFPLAEWNDLYRDAVRKFWLSDIRRLVEGGSVPGPNELATRIAGSADLFGRGSGNQRGPKASINFVAAHDGFTLADLTRYDHKHNWENQEDNRDGSSNNNSWNHGLEGPAVQWEGPGPDRLSNNDLSQEERKSIEVSRQRSARNLLATLLISAGTPMLNGGDEMLRSQRGNNNTYCQDSPTSWFDWNLVEQQENFLRTTKYLLGLRSTYPVLRPRLFSTGQTREGDAIPDVSWLDRNANPLERDGWSDPMNRVFQMRRSGKPCSSPDALVVINGTAQDAHVQLGTTPADAWSLVFDTTWASPAQGGLQDPAKALVDGQKVSAGTEFAVEAQSMAIFLGRRSK